MSRGIPAKQSVTITANERGLLDTEGGKLVFTEYKGRQCALLLKGGRLAAASFYTNASCGRIGAVYIGKIKNIANNLEACFVEIGGGEICFLPLKKARNPFLTNRVFDGRLLEGDELLVQVERDAQKNKQAAVTAQISLSNDYYALALGPARLGFSTRLERQKKENITKLFTEHGLLLERGLNQDPKDILTNVAKLEGSYSQTVINAAAGNSMSAEVVPASIQVPSFGAIARTRLSELTEESTMLVPFYQLVSELLKLLHKAATRSCFSCLQEAPAPWEAELQTLAASREYTEIVTDSQGLYQELAAYCEEHLPEKAVRLYQEGGLTLSALYGLESKMETALKPKVWLKSGGYLIIEHTEALTVIDVNSGKNETGKNSSALKRLNHEAAEEIALQLRLRNLSGIILVDFINMEDRQSDLELLEHLRELVRSDRVKTIVVDITPLGLVEITRKKQKQPLEEQFRQS